MSAYNSEAYLAEAIESVLNQTFTDFEFMIYEDCSKDNTLSILEHYAALDKRINLIVNTVNKGLTANLIDGVNKAKGKYLARMDADDVCMLNRLQKQFDFLEEHSDVSLLGSSVTYFDNNGFEFIAYQPTSHNELKVLLLLGFTLLHPSVIMRIDDLRKHNLNYNPEYRYAQDHDLWVRCLFSGLKIANIYEPLLKMREHPNKISATLKPKQQFFSNQTRDLQLKEYKIELLLEELSAFHDLSSGKPDFTLEVLNHYEKALLRIINSNKNTHYLDQKHLEVLASEFFRLKCRSFMINNNQGPWEYWKSTLRKYDRLSLKSKIKFMCRSLLCFILIKYN